MIDKGIPRHHYQIKTSSGEPLGHVTSGTQSPSLQKAIVMGYAKTEVAVIGSEIFI